MWFFRQNKTMQLRSYAWNSHCLHKGAVWFTAGRDDPTAYQLPANSSFHHALFSLYPSFPPDTSISAATLFFFFFCSFTHILLYLCRWSTHFHFQTRTNVTPPDWLMPSLQTIREAAYFVRLTCLCCSRSALFPTRIMGNSSLSFTRRICLWNL